MMLVSAAALAQGQSANLPRYEFFGGYSVNADYVRNLPVLLALDQKVSPFFSLGSGPYGFEFSVKRYVRNGLGLKTDFSGYYDPFPSSKGINTAAPGWTTISRVLVPPPGSLTVCKVNSIRFPR